MNSDPQAAEPGRDRFNRAISYLRVSLTERCNLKCFYCRPTDVPKPHQDELSAADLLRIIRAGVRVGIKKVRLTGGEPLVRPDVPTLVTKLAEIPEIDDIALTTNGLLLAPQAARLKTAGLRRVNISLDTLNPDRFRRITRHGQLSAVWHGVEAALTHGLHPVKLNMVVMRGVNDDEVVRFAHLAVDHPLHVRFIELMPIGASSAKAAELFVSANEIRGAIEERYGPLRPVKPTGNGGPARCWTALGFKGSIGFISPLSGYFCSSCNRLRLTAVGTLRPCLCEADELDLAGPLARGANEDELAALISMAIARKPEGNTKPGIQPVKDRLMSQIGG